MKCVVTGPLPLSDRSVWRPHSLLQTSAGTLYGFEAILEPVNGGRGVDWDVATPIENRSIADVSDIGSGGDLLSSNAEEVANADHHRQ